MRSTTPPSAPPQSESEGYVDHLRISTEPCQLPSRFQNENCCPYGRYLEKHGYDVWADPHSFTYPQHTTRRSVYPEEHHQTTWVADRSIEFLNEHASDEPFFLWTSFVDPHHPFTPPAPYDEMYTPSDMPLPKRSEDEEARWPEAYRRKYRATEGGHEAIGMSRLSDAEWQRIAAFYYGMMSLIDKQVGRILDVLREKGIADDTVVVFTADHGEMLGDHGLVFKGTTFEQVTRMPLILSRASAAGGDGSPGRDVGDADAGDRESTF